MDVHDNLWKWVPGVKVYLETTAASLEEVLAEKDVALEEINRLKTLVRGEDEAFRALVEQFCAYTEMFCHAAKAVYLVKMRELDSGWRPKAKAEIEAMTQSSLKLQGFKPKRYYGEVLFSRRRTESLVNDLNRFID